MENYLIWLIKILLAHLLTDFVLQPASWIESRNKKHFSSPYLYLHGLVTAAVALVFVGLEYWPSILVILVTHVLIDGWKSYQPPLTKYFLADQALHVLVILVNWYVLFLYPDDLLYAWEKVNTKNTLILITAFVFVTQPAGILIGQLTKKWRDQIEDAVTLGNAGKWIGITERIIILALVMNGQYGAIGLLIAAKGLLRFNETNRPEIKTEYLLIGTLISISLALFTGLAAMRMIEV